MNKKLMIAEAILKKLNKEREINKSIQMSERQFSRKWLQKSSEAGKILNLCLKGSQKCRRFPMLHL